ncbi:MAG TPA: SMR family transporter [Actinomycetospora sp.]|nr:SMR family transporter [Actinomycetospora sp.]
MVLLGAAIVSEVVGTMSLPASDGLTRPLPSLGVVVGYAGAIVLFTRALRHGLTLGIAYGTLTGFGLASATVLGAVVLGEHLSLVQGAGLALIVGGALLLQHRGIDREVRA